MKSAAPVLHSLALSLWMISSALTFPAAAGEPPLQLKGFVKTALLAKGASATVRFALSDRSFSTWDVASHAWVVASGTFGVHVGASSRDIRLNATIAI